MAEELVCGDAINVIIKHVAGGGAMNGKGKDGHESLAAGQVGTPYADERERVGVSRRCVTAPPCGRCATGDALGL
jgi:hypothetical protein